MVAICPVCSSSPSMRGAVDADVVRKLTLKQLSRKYRLSGRAVLRHIRHLPELLESEAAASRPSIYIGSVTYNISMFVVGSDAEEDETSELVGSDEEGEGVRT